MKAKIIEKLTNPKEREKVAFKMKMAYLLVKYRIDKLKEEFKNAHKSE